MLVYTKMNYKVASVFVVMGFSLAGTFQTGHLRHFFPRLGTRVARGAVGQDSNGMYAGRYRISFSL